MPSRSGIILDQLRTKDGSRDHFAYLPHAWKTDQAHLGYRLDERSDAFASDGGVGLVPSANAP